MTMETARRTDIPDIPTGDPQWRQTLGRRACRHLMAGLEPAHWTSPEYKKFRSILELLVLTNTASQTSSGTPQSPSCSEQPTENPSQGWKHDYEPTASPEPATAGR